MRKLPLYIFSLLGFVLLSYLVDSFLQYNFPPPTPSKPLTKPLPKALPKTPSKTTQKKEEVVAPPVVKEKSEREVMLENQKKLGCNLTQEEEIYYSNDEIPDRLITRAVGKICEKGFYEFEVYDHTGRIIFSNQLFAGDNPDKRIKLSYTFKHYYGLMTRANVQKWMKSLSAFFKERRVYKASTLPEWGSDDFIHDFNQDGFDPTKQPSSMTVSKEYYQMIQKKNWYVLEYGFSARLQAYVYDREQEKSVMIAEWGH